MIQILIADNKKENILNARLILENNCIIFPARTKNWMMKVLKKKKIDLIIMNISIDEKEEALTIMEKIRKSEKYKNIPFVITAGDSKKEIQVVRECMKIGNCEAVMVPFEREELLEAVAHV